SLLLHSEPRGFGFIQYVDPADAAEAKYHMDGRASQGRQLKIVFGEESRKKAQEMRARERGSGRGGRNYDRRVTHLGTITLLDIHDLHLPATMIITLHLREGNTQGLFRLNRKNTVMRDHILLVQLRRHGDILKRTIGGYLVVNGRADDTMNLGGIKSVIESVAFSAAPPNGGPEELSIFVVVKEGMNIISPDTLKKRFSRALQSNLNPLFEVRWVKIVGMLPRTASNKLLRRVLREQWKQHVQIQSKL
ncbi:hypothetical protein EJD97_000251, partial [Solanum chilense]